MAAIGGGPPGCMGATTRNPNSSTASVAQLVASVTYTPTASWYASTSGRTSLSCVKPPSTKGADLFRGCAISLWSASPPDPVHCEGVSGCENRRLTLDLAADGVDAGGAVDLQQEQAQPVTHLRQRQGRRQLLTSVGLPNQEPYRHQRQRHVMMPALPGTHLILVHAHLALAPLEAGFNTGASLDHTRQFPKRRLLERHLAPSHRREVVMVAITGVLIGGIQGS